MKPDRAFSEKVALGQILSDPFDIDLHARISKGRKFKSSHSNSLIAHFLFRRGTGQSWGKGFLHETKILNALTK
jgi:hypothetical protein